MDDRIEEIGNEKLTQFLDDLVKDVDECQIEVAKLKNKDKQLLYIIAGVGAVTVFEGFMLMQTMTTVRQIAQNFGMLVEQLQGGSVGQHSPQAQQASQPARQAAYSAPDEGITEQVAEPFATPESAVSEQTANDLKEMGPQSGMGEEPIVD